MSSEGSSGSEAKLRGFRALEAAVSGSVRVTQREGVGVGFCSISADSLTLKYSLMLS